MTSHYRQRLGTADSGKNSHPTLASASFSRILSAYSRGSRFKIERVASGLPKFGRVSINFNFSFPLSVLGITVYQRIPRSPTSPRRGPCRGPFFESRYEGILVGMEGFDKTLEGNFFSQHSYILEMKY